MELGALVCTPKAPLCLVCPVAARVPGPGPGAPGDAAGARPPSRPRWSSTEACALVARQGRWLIVQRGAGRSLGGVLGVPDHPPLGGRPGRPAASATPVDLAEGVRRLTGVDARIGPLVETIRYGVTRHRVDLDAYRAVGLDRRPRPPGPAWSGPPGYRPKTWPIIPLGRPAGASSPGSPGTARGPAPGPPDG